MKTLSSYQQIAVLLFVLVSGFLYLLWCYLPAIRLVWRCLSLEERFPIWNTLRACRGCLWPVRPVIFRKQMRLWLELRILHPKPLQEPGWYFDKSSKRYRLEFDDRRYQRLLAVWRRKVRRKFSALKLNEVEPLIEVSDVFRLNDEVTKHKIKHYLLAVADLDLSSDEEASFLCDVKVNEGFLLPLNLLAGLMSRFSDDWDPIISCYGEMAAKSFSPQQISVFNLWLLWGPSVPICGCDQWAGPITFQYGFGDENNSVRVRVRDKVKEQLLADFNKDVQARNSGAYPALHASITGRLWPPSSFAQGDICGAQHELLNPDREAFILEYKSHTAIGNPAGSSLLYTAYVWAMFVVGRAEKPTLSEIRSAPWLHVIPFFEHANIVDESTYRMAKLQLAQKIIAFVKNCAQFEANADAAPLRLWYVSAIDESGCGHAIEVRQKGESIRSVLEELLRQGELAAISERIVTDDHSFGELLSGCHLSQVVSELFEEIEEGSVSRRRKRTKSPH
jgi:hypothetical protein